MVTDRDFSNFDLIERSFSRVLENLEFDSKKDLSKI